MLKQITLLPLAERDFNAILEYLNKNWDTKVTANFIDLAESLIDQISNNPKQYPIILKGKESENVFLQNIILFSTGTQDHK